jgi:hypothetical protein
MVFTGPADAMLAKTLDILRQVELPSAHPDNSTQQHLKAADSKLFDLSNLMQLSGSLCTCDAAVCTVSLPALQLRGTSP